MNWLTFNLHASATFERGGSSAMANALRSVIRVAFKMHPVDKRGNFVLFAKYVLFNISPTRFSSEIFRRLSNLFDYHLLQDVESSDSMLITSIALNI